ncbi:hypothetical protein J6590_037819 [Homalodisca vitripennis]|nr:hypothetical protein J6590_037819 [Homalodisca vitripennis]
MFREPRKVDKVGGGTFPAVGSAPTNHLPTVTSLTHTYLNISQAQPRLVPASHVDTHMGTGHLLLDVRLLLYRTPLKKFLAFDVYANIHNNWLIILIWWLLKNVNTSYDTRLFQAQTHSPAPASTSLE